MKRRRKVSQKHRIAALLVLQGGLLVALSLWTCLSFHLHGLMARQPHPRLVSQQRQPSHVSNDADYSIQGQGQHDRNSKIKTQQQVARNITMMLQASQNPSDNIIHTRNQLPAWMRNYTRWHQQQIKSLRRLDFEQKDKDIPHNYRFLVLRCLKHDTNCGGTADRLKPWPLVVRLAAQTKRIVWILWERPCGLEAFLVPPLSTNSSYDDSKFTTLDWRVMPMVLQRALNVNVSNDDNNNDNSTVVALPTDWARSFPQIGTSQDIETILNPAGERKQRNKRFKMWMRQEKYPVITMLFQSHDHGSEIYNKYKNQAYFKVLSNGNILTSNPSPNLTKEPQPSYEQVFRPCWKMSFQPSAAVQSRIDQSLQGLGLQTDRYVAVHIRALYQQAAGPKKTVFVAKNALHCASQLRRSKHEPILVATDAIQSTVAAIEYAAEHHPSTAVVVTPRPLDQSHKQDIAPLHLDRGSTFLSKNASDWTQEADPAAYYDTFVDLYLLANARCIAYHLGNYGKWANLLSSDPSCSVNHFKKMCRWKEDY